MKAKYMPKDPEGRRWRLAEECAEVIKELAKIGRFGLDNYHPDDPEQVKNVDRLMTEIADMAEAAALVMADLKLHNTGTITCPKCGGRQRFSDASSYDFKCTECGATE